MYLTLVSPFMFADDSAKALRIDVVLPGSDVEKELELLYERLNKRGDSLYRLPPICINLAGLIFRYRVADGEHYIYVEDPRRHCLAGYTVLNRLIELDRCGDRILRAPHSKYGAPYQRQGIASAIYKWWLDSGNCLISGARQSEGAHALWKSLGEHYRLIYVDLRNRKLSYLGSRIDDQLREGLHTRLVLLGKNWSVQDLVLMAGMQGANDNDKIQGPSAECQRRRA